METLWRWNNLASVLIKDITGATSTYSNISKVALQSVYGGQAIFHENGGGGGGVQSDWNQNNPEEGSHILNRPFYSEYEYITTELTEKNTATYTELSSNGSIYYNATLFEQVAWNKNINENDNFQLIWDNVIFNKINDNFIQPVIKNNIIYFGNLNLFDQNENDNNFYFCIALFPKGSHPDHLDFYVIESRTKETFIEHSYQINKIESVNEIIHTLDKKYLPEGIGTQPNWNETDINSPSYIQNKPKIQEPLQSNWDQVDGFELDFIKNKPFGKKANIVKDGIYNFTTYDLNSSKYISSEIIPYLEEIKEGDICLVRFDGKDYEVPFKVRKGILFAVNGNQVGEINELSLGNISLRAFSYGTIVADDSSDSIYPFYISKNQSAANKAGKFQVCVTLKDDIKIIDKQYLPDMQPDWENLDVNSLSYIQNRPFGEVPDIINNGTYNFSSSGVDGIYISNDISIGYMPKEYDKVNVTWGQTTYNCQVERQSYRQKDYTYIDVNGIGNPNLCIIDNKLGQLSGSNSSTLPFFIDLTNKKVYSNSNQKIKVNAWYGNGIKYLDSKYLKGELLPTIDRKSSIYTENYTMVVDSSGIWRSTVIPPQDWNEDNPFINSFIFNKPCYETYENIVDIMYMPMSSTGNIEAGFAGALMDSLESLQTGKYYYINMNGSTFKAKCKAGDPNTTVKFEFGNVYLADKNATNTGEDFYIAITDMQGDKTIAGQALFTSIVYCRGFTGGPHITIRENNALKVKKLDSKYLPIDKTLKKTNYVADAKATGDLINSMKTMIQDLQSQVNMLTQRIIALENSNPNAPTTPTVSVSGETLHLESGLINNENLELTYGEIQNESLIFNNYSSNSSATVVEGELNISGSIDVENNEILTSSGVVTADGVWEV